MLSVTNDGQLRSARIHPDAINHVSPVSSFVPVPFFVPSRFAVLDEVVLGGSGNKVVRISQKSRQRARRHLGKSRALRISSVSVSVSVCAPMSVSSSVSISPSASVFKPVSVYGDLGSEDPLTLSCFVNEDILATCMIDSGASSQFIDLDFAMNMNLPLVPKGKPEDLVLVDGACSIIGQIMHTCNLNLAIDQHVEELTFQVTKLAGWNLIIGKPWLRRHNPSINWVTNTIVFSSGYCHAHCLLVRRPPAKATGNKFQILLISRTALHIALKDPDSQFCIMALCSDDKATHDTRVAEEEHDPAKKLVPHEYHDYLVLFSEKEARILPPSRYIDHAIPLTEGAKPPFRRMYSMSDAELKEVRKWIDENLSKSFMRASSSSAASPILFVKKTDGSLHLCIDYRALNDITIKDRTSLPRIEETLNQIQGCKYFTRLDLRACFN